jgi:hypothetical protein
MFWLGFELGLDRCRRLPLSAHAADELARLLWREIFWGLVFEWEQRAALDNTLDLKVPWKLLESREYDDCDNIRTP